jgi:hypothetical protein
VRYRHPHWIIVAAGENPSRKKTRIEDRGSRGRPSILASGEQLPHRFAAVDEADGPADRGEVLLPRVDVQRVAAGAENGITTGNACPRPPPKVNPMLKRFALTVLLLAVVAGASGAGGTVTEPVRLFNGKDLTGFYTYLEKYGKNNDPEKVFTVVDGAVRVSGEVFGAFITEKEYENYHLVVEFKWGERTGPKRAQNARDSGILLHCVGEDGAAGGVWMESIECQMIEGGTGDFILVKGKNQPTLTARAEKRGGEFYFNPQAEPVKFTSGRINWFDRDPAWKDVKGFRGKHDVEKEVGQWNTLECICDGDKITVVLNKTVVNAGTSASHTRGKILFQSEGAEVFFRRIDLLPLKK